MPCNCSDSYYNKQCDSKNYNYNSSLYNNNGTGNCERNCAPCNKYCTPCYPIYSPVTQYYSEKFHALEHNYPMHKCLCNDFGTNPRYYNKPHVPCDCKKKCYPC